MGLPVWLMLFVSFSALGFISAFTDPTGLVDCLLESRVNLAGPSGEVLYELIENKQHFFFFLFLACLSV